MSQTPPVRRGRRVASFVVDWLYWLYLPYCGFLVYYIRYVRLPWEIEKKIVLPELPLWGWVGVALAAAELALLFRAFGHTLGQRAFGYVLTGSRGRPTLGQRIRYFAASHLAPVALVGSASRPWHERVSGIGLAPLGLREGTSPRKPWYRTGYGLAALVGVGLTVAVGWHVVEVSLAAMVRDIDKPARLWDGLTNPDFTYFVEVDPGTDDSIAGALVESLFMALLATVFGAAVAFPLSFLGARNITAKGPVGLVVYGVSRGFFNVFRSIESLMWASIFAIWVGWGAFAGTLALLIHTIAALGKLYSEQVEHIDPGPVEAVAAAGGNWLQTIRYAVVPQVIPPFLAFTVYRWDINLRMATVVSIVGGGGIGRLLFYYKDGLEWAAVGAIILTFAAAVWALDYLSGWVREKIT